MGLDVYLYRYENKSETDRIENEYTSKSDKIWADAGDYDSLTQEQKDDCYKKCLSIAQELGLDVHGYDNNNKKRIEINSKLDPDHIFKIGYFRSSYNSNGLNRVLSNMGIYDLNDIFEPDDECSFQPDWAIALETCDKAIKDLESKGNYRCFEISDNMFSPSECNSEKQAMDIFLSEKTKESDDSRIFHNYSNINGSFYLDGPLKVLAIIPGNKIFMNSKNKCSYIIVDDDNDWYITALKIVKETIEWVLKQDDINKYYLYWSG